jgi:hypothetical protein
VVGCLKDALSNTTMASDNIACLPVAYMTMLIVKFPLPVRAALGDLDAFWRVLEHSIRRNGKFFSGDLFLLALSHFVPLDDTPLSFLSYCTHVCNNDTLATKLWGAGRRRMRGVRGCESLWG